NYSKTFPLLLTMWSFVGLSQERITADFGKPSQQEFAMTSYQRAPMASAVVLFEKEKTYFRLVDNRIRLVKEFHRKIKVFNAQRFEDNTVEIVFRSDKSIKETVQKITAITHNGSLQNYVGDDKIFTKELSPYYSIKTFTFPNVNDGSILEYRYTLYSNNLFALDGWSFQGKLPRIYSEMETEIPGNFVYNKVLVGNEKLDINEVKLRKDCFSLPGYVKNADCEAGVYAMKDVPPFRVEEYMLSASNYLARINFELQAEYDHKGYKTDYSKDWDDIDKQFRTEKNIGGQLKASFFKGKIPESIQNLSDPLEKARAVYSWIQEYYTWNGRFDFWSDVRVKNAYENRTGSVSEINLSLINALDAVGLDAKIMLLSTRENGLPTRTYPVLSEFNYLICFLRINDTDYLLDASSKFVPFNMVPFRALNLYGRVMDFRKGSYWYDIRPYAKNVLMVRSNLSIGSDAQLEGEVQETRLGYVAIERREKLAAQESNEYASRDGYDALGITTGNYRMEGVRVIGDRLIETYDMKLELEEIDEIVYFRPLEHQAYYKENPFQLSSRSYPVELGYPLTITNLMKLDTGAGFEVESLPENKVVALPDNGGSLNVVYSEANGVINIRLNLKITKDRFAPAYYQGLKDFFSQLITLQSKDIIALKRVGK
ncbi:MAG: transglutaminase domain-containing protein, partial [Bacteroidota bacterium]